MRFTSVSQHQLSLIELRWIHCVVSLPFDVAGFTIKVQKNVEDLVLQFIFCGVKSALKTKPVFFSTQLFQNLGFDQNFKTYV